jgi:hypothetical protein
MQIFIAHAAGLRYCFAAALSSFEEMLRIPSNSGCAGTEESEGRSAITGNILIQRYIDC